MSIQEFNQWLDNQDLICDKLVYLRQRYNFERGWEHSHELLLVDMEQPNNYYWENDWNEGQQNVEILGCINICDILVPLFNE